MSTRWPSTMYVKFFKIYETYDLLWNKQHPDYKNQLRKQNAIRSMIKQLGLPMEVMEMKMKIKNIRTVYCRELQKIKNMRAQGIPYRSSLHWFKYAHKFLKPVVAERVGIQEDFEEPQEDDSPRASDAEDPGSPPPTEGDKARPPSPHVPKQRISINLPPASRSAPTKRSHSKRHHEPCASCSVANYLRRREEAEIVAKSWAIELEKMEEMQQVYAKKAIGEILMEGRLGILHRNVVRVDSDVWTEENQLRDVDSASDTTIVETKHDVSASSNPFESIH